MEIATLFLRDKGLNHSFKLDGGNFKGTLIELLREYETELSKLRQDAVSGAVCNSPCCKGIPKHEVKIPSEFYCEECFKQTER